MEEAIKNFNEQFGWEPVVENAGALPKVDRFVVGGMGGSHLAAGVLSDAYPELPLLIWNDYGIPKHTNGALFIASSYSGNTEETIDFAKAALEQGQAVSTLSVGGKLLALAREIGLPHVAMPDTGIQPRAALGYSTKALALLIGRNDIAKELTKLRTLRPEAFREDGKVLAKRLEGKIPVVYASRRNGSLAYNWKIKCNETGKIPSFSNVFPELDHNELAGFDAVPDTKTLSERIVFVMLRDSEDHPQVQKRMEVTADLYRSRGFTVEAVELVGESRLERLFSALLLGDWTALHLSALYGTEPDKVALIEELKKRL